MPQISAGEDKASIESQLETLRQNGWEISGKGGLQKTFYFKTYTKVADFHHVIATRCKSENHHPTMTTRAGSIDVHWITHSPPGLSHKDPKMAMYCDEQARHIGTTEPSQARKCGP
ncbi:transcriptional coactivator/pterin dehydratase [Aaosphaeria arxii CBS 175.79]|uniref:4a-hydroxytetrahydrobiopterin dehydratase n=1 Tax=Aaosphaeria arxii CBS 175.79 TaxID=1450172 RepID=A0A6A5XPC5_9PLEO|nr:transcriptional coactivator/pterin dehydratase [Aaosphaeria arxii CBS 175.79]KAF2015098.1 transcriptional coactivator/pterin dehydratase [Aaosphaeria arxii CBS 175.79]